ncbi:hypothetical protein HanRHA438_Chr10g0479461 [Helianthus annuus]|nr:hypothetical protein HanRHA438_Chr10g0479461 [Helianthus annuus]
MSKKKNCHRVFCKFGCVNNNQLCNQSRNGKSQLEEVMGRRLDQRYCCNIECWISEGREQCIIMVVGLVGLGDLSWNESLSYGL